MAINMMGSVGAVVDNLRYLFKHRRLERFPYSYIIDSNIRQKGAEKVKVSKMKGKKGSCNGEQ